MRCLEPTGIDAMFHSCTVVNLDEICCGAVTFADGFDEFGAAVHDRRRRRWHTRRAGCRRRSGFETVVAAVRSRSARRSKTAPGPARQSLGVARARTNQWYRRRANRSIRPRYPLTRHRPATRRASRRQRRAAATWQGDLPRCRQVPTPRPARGGGLRCRPRSAWERASDGWPRTRGPGQRHRACAARRVVALRCRDETDPRFASGHPGQFDRVIGQRAVLLLRRPSWSRSPPGWLVRPRACGQGMRDRGFSRLIFSPARSYWHDRRTHIRTATVDAPAMLCSTCWPTRQHTRRSTAPAG